MVVLGIALIGIGIVLYAVMEIAINSAQWQHPGNDVFGGGKGYTEQVSNDTNGTYAGVAISGTGVILLGAGAVMNTMARFEQNEELGRIPR